MKKAMKWAIALAVLVVIGYGLWMGNQKYEEYVEDKVEAIENLAEAEYGASCVYSKEDVEYFKSKALEQMDKEVKKYDLSYGENALIKADVAYFGKYHVQALGEEGLAELVENRKTETYFMPDPDVFEEYELIYSKGTSIDNILNKDLSLKNPKVFYGYTSVDNPSTKLMKSSPNFDVRFNYFVAFLKEVDEKYKDSSTSLIVERLIESDNDGFIKPSGWDTEIRLNETYALYQQWLLETKENSLNPLQRLLKVEKLTNIEEIAPWGLKLVNPLKEKDYVKYEPLADEFNYFVANENQYFTTYWPSSVSKVDDNTYIVHISTDKPVERLGATNITQNILRYFAHSESEYINDDYPKLIVKIGDEVYHDMNSGILMADVLNGNSFITGKEGAYYMNGISCNTELAPWQAWSPSEDVRPWVDAYFSVAAKAYKEDNYFSIFETIEQVAEEFNVDYEDVENVIMSCYWTFNGYSIHFFVGK